MGLCWIFLLLAMKHIGNLHRCFPTAADTLTAGADSCYEILAREIDVKAYLPGLPYSKIPLFKIL